jgi:uncharacterized protein
MAFCFEAPYAYGLTVESAMDIYFEIEADDPGRAINFYSQVFGWRFSQDEGPEPYWRIEADVSYGGLLPRTAIRPPTQCGANAFVCSIEVENFDATEQTIQRLGGLVKEPKFPVSGQSWQGYFIDTEGNTFGIFEVDERAGL